MSTPMDVGDNSQTEHNAFKPPSMKPGGFNLRKQALLAHQSHSVMDSVHEDAMQTSIQECSRLSIDSPPGQQPSSSKRAVQLHSWNEYWDSKQQVDIPDRYVHLVCTVGL